MGGRIKQGAKIMEIIYLYWAFSALFMLGSAVEDAATGSKQSFFIYFVGILLAPAALPFALGIMLTKGSKDE